MQQQNKAQLQTFDEIKPTYAPQIKDRTVLSPNL